MSVFFFVFVEKKGEDGRLWFIVLENCDGGGFDRVGGMGYGKSSLSSLTFFCSQKASSADI